MSTREALFAPLDIHECDITAYRTDIGSYTRSYLSCKPEIELFCSDVRIVLVGKRRIGSFIRLDPDMFFQNLCNGIWETHDPILPKTHRSSRTDASKLSDYRLSPLFRSQRTRHAENQTDE